MRLLWVGASLLCVPLVGCLDELAEGSDAGDGSAGSISAFVLPASGSSTVTYDNGHPLVFETTDPMTRANEADVEALINNHRVAMGMNALQSVSLVQDVARAHSAHMIVHDPAFFDHVNPEGDRPADRAAQAGVASSSYSENIAAGYATAESVVAAWLASEGHRANIENPEWTHTGVGYACAPADPSGYYDYWTQNFMRP
jgi:uncharacterized protein YkwD